jgi:hypothetical protein
MARRFDISDKLIHFTGGGECTNEAFARLRAIIRSGRLIAKGYMIRGGYRCVCFTEAPPAAFARAFISDFPFTRYSQFGLMFKKNWIYERGGRPVIYQPESDFELLPEELRWRHVRFELTGEKVVDWTWEREWRILGDELAFTPAEVVIIVPNEQWAKELRRLHDVDQDMIIELYAKAVDQEIAEIWRETFPWRVVALG